jgi:short-subunit dehydrogenase
MLITGASAGIGAELARLAAAGGHDVVLVARSRQALEALAQELHGAGAAAHVIVEDLGEPGAAQRVFDEVESRGFEIDALVNNAGYGMHAQFWQGDVRVGQALLRVNVEALTMLTRLFLPGMVARGRGRVLNMASLAGFQPGPMMAAYYASKAYVISFSQALANELHGTGVTMTVLCPGPVRTGFDRRAGVDISRLYNQVPVADARSVAQAGYAGMMRGRRLVIPGVLNRIVATLSRHAPMRLSAAIARALHERVA